MLYESKVERKYNAIVFWVFFGLQTPVGTPLLSPSRSPIPNQVSKSGSTTFQQKIESNSFLPSRLSDSNECDVSKIDVYLNEEEENSSADLGSNDQTSAFCTVASKSCDDDTRIPGGLARLKLPLPRNDAEDSLPNTASFAAAVEQQHLIDTRTAHLASLAEMADVKGLERALDAVPVSEASNASPFLPSIPSKTDLQNTVQNSGTEKYDKSDQKQVFLPDSSQNGDAASGLNKKTDSVHSKTRTDVGQEKEGHGSNSTPIERVDTPPDPRRALMRERRAAEWQKMTIPERDAVIVISAMCRIAGRELKSASAEPYLQNGKLLALEVLVGMMTHPSHDWSQARHEFTSQLRQPLCLALLRNCIGPSDDGVNGSARILGAIVSSSRLREGLKSEIGALYPMIFLRPLESDKPDSAVQAMAALRGLSSLASSPQILADIFVNFDCNLQAANLFERSVKALSKAACIPGIASLSSKDALHARQIAIKSLIDTVKSLDTWAGPLKAIDLINHENSKQMETQHYEDGSDLTSSTNHKNLSDCSKALHQEILDRLHSDKALKENLVDGMAIFNKDPIEGLAALQSFDILRNDPTSIVEFLREHKNHLDPAAVGELFGHHDEKSIKVMHHFIDTEASFEGLTLDMALRRLLLCFRLPGEAQKIDRIVEKFAQKYCQDNPEAFPAADAAYLLAFAIIMLNTDAHNPMADARISEEDFVTMCVYQAEDSGEFTQILPREQLVKLYKRIKNEEITPISSSNHVDNINNSKNDESKTKKGSRSTGVDVGTRSAKLAAALGLRKFTAPFWSGAKWDKQYGVDIERKRLLELTGQLLAQTPGGGHSSGGIAGTVAPISIWHTATHSEHARPMLEVSGKYIGYAFDSALDRCSSVAEAAPILEAYAIAARLAALLLLENKCEMFVEGLSKASRLRDPAAPRTSKEAQQVAALSRLIWLGGCSDAGALGSAWIVIFRALSDLEALRVHLTSLPSGGENRDGSKESSAFYRFFTKIGFTNGSSQKIELQDSTLEIRSKTSSHNNGQSVAASPKGSRLPGSPSSIYIGDSPGMGAVLWAETAGSGPIDRIFTNSPSLDGDAVVVFFRALCAVSQSELDCPENEYQEKRSIIPPRIHLLQRIVECTYLNSDRIRLVWHRIWTVVSQHLISAACHHDSYIAMYAVDALRKLSDKLLCRAELAGFATQSEALRPMAAILKGSDSSAVRELVVACVAHAVHAHRKRMGGSGWRAVVEALTVAAGDNSAAVVTQSLDAMAPLFAALYASDGGGHDLLRECVAAALMAISNSAPEIEDLSAAGLLLMQTLARRLGEASIEQLEKDSLGESSQDSSSEKVHHHLYSRQNAMLNTCLAPSILKAREGNDNGILYGLWKVILLPLTYIARLDRRTMISNSSAAVLFQIFLQTEEDAIPAPIWAELFKDSIMTLLKLSFDNVLDEIYDKKFFHSNETPSSARINRRPYQCGLALLDCLLSSTARLGSIEGTSRILRHARHHIPDLWDLLSMGTVKQTYVKPNTESTNKNSTVLRLRRNGRSSYLLPLCLQILWEYILDGDAEASSLGNEQLQNFLQEVGPALGPDDWLEVENKLRDLVMISHRVLEEYHRKVTQLEPSNNLENADLALYSPVGSSEIRHSCRTTIMAMRCISELLQSSAQHIPTNIQIRLLETLENAVKNATNFNSSTKERIYFAKFIGLEQTFESEAGARTCNSEGVDTEINRSENIRILSESQHEQEAANTDQNVRYEPSAATDVYKASNAPQIHKVMKAANVCLNDSWSEKSLPSLTRQETEGARILLAALQRTALKPEALDQDGIDELQEHGIHHLVRVSIDVVTASIGKAKQKESIMTLDTLANHASHQSQHEISDSAEWSMRANTIRDALLALSNLPIKSWESEKSVIFRIVAELVGTNDLKVRKAVQQFMLKHGAVALGVQSMS